MPANGWFRVPRTTRSPTPPPPAPAERDSAAKEAMLKLRQSGRILLVPPDNSGGMITAPLPFLSKGPSRAQRA